MSPSFLPQTKCPPVPDLDSLHQVKLDVVRWSNLDILVVKFDHDILVWLPLGAGVRVWVRGGVQEGGPRSDRR